MMKTGQLPGNYHLCWWCGLCCHYQQEKVNNKVESKLEGLVVLGVFVVSNLLLFHVIGF